MKPLLILLVSLLFTSAHAQDPAMKVIEETAEENLAKNPTPELNNLWGAGVRIGFPHPFNLTAQYYDSSRKWSAEFSFGSAAMTYESADVKIDNYEINLRWHPSQNPFYVGLGYGNQKIEIKDSDIILGQKVSGKLEVESKYLKPAIGWIWMRRNSQFYWGMELGWQFPSDDKTTVTTSQDLTGNADYDQLVKDINDIGDQLGQSAIPNVGLIKLGWFF
jgi:hypothetical protein